MSYLPIRIQNRALHHADASIAIIRRYGQEYVDFRFGRRCLAAAGWNRATRIAPFWDAEAGHLMFATSGTSDSSARALNNQGGYSLSARFPRVDMLRDLIQPFAGRSVVRVVRSGEGQVVLDLVSLHSAATPNPQPALS